DRAGAGAGGAAAFGVVSRRAGGVAGATGAALPCGLASGEAGGAAVRAGGVAWGAGGVAAESPEESTAGGSGTVATVATGSRSGVFRGRLSQRMSAVIPTAHTSAATEAIRTSLPLSRWKRLLAGG